MEATRFENFTVWSIGSIKVESMQCEVMRDYALKFEIPKKNILMQNFSSDTIGEAFFVKKMFLAPNKWHKNIIVTSGYHRERVSLIYSAVLGRSYESE